MFLKRPSYNPFTAIVDRSPGPLMAGEQVYALQTAINAYAGTSLTTDGICGPKTGKEIWNVQAKLNLVLDGKAGVLTQRALALAILSFDRPDLYALGKGQLEHESSYWLGNYSEAHEDGSWDAGVTQLNTNYTSPSVAFNTPRAIKIYVAKTEAAYESYSDKSKFVGSDHTEKRRLQLAGGHWNAPAYANWLAGLTTETAKPGPLARETLETYMTEVSVYV